jgi:mono/diheme cytochrome c family protein
MSKANQAPLEDERSDGLRLVGAVAVFESPDDLLDAVERAREAGFTRLDTVSPYPIHGIDGILGARPSRLGYVAAAAGLIATGAAKTAQWWTSAVDYPLNIGGSPLFSLPAFVPVTFELMVLFASLASVVGMLAVFNRLPQYGNGLLRSKSIKDLTCDKFGLVVDASDPSFQADSAAELGGPRAVGVELLYRRRASRFFWERIFSAPFLLLLAAVALFAFTSTRMVFRYGGAVPPFDFMKRQVKLTAQHESAAFPDRLGMRSGVEGTVTRGLLPYPYPRDPDAAAANLVNPVSISQASLKRGRDCYGVFCRPCHGVLGDGRGTLTSAFPKAPTLHSGKVRAWKDGRIYAVITEGQNVMPAHASQISREDRWRIIRYVRVLQRSQNAQDSDLQ